MDEQIDLLNSWKEIAVYLGRSMRTVQRWERELQLPVRRPRNRRRSPVLAFRSDLDQWLAAINHTSLSMPEDPTSEMAVLAQRLQVLRAEMRKIESQIGQLRRRMARIPKNSSDKAAA